MEVREVSGRPVGDSRGNFIARSKTAKVKRPPDLKPQSISGTKPVSTSDD